MESRPVQVPFDVWRQLDATGDFRSSWGWYQIQSRAGDGGYAYDFPLARRSYADITYWETGNEYYGGNQWCGSWAQPARMMADEKAIVTAINPGVARRS